MSNQVQVDTMNDLSMKDLVVLMKAQAYLRDEPFAISVNINLPNYGAVIVWKNGSIYREI